MTDAFDQGGLTIDRGASSRWDTVLANAAQAGPPLLFGLRLWASVCLALYVAFWLELDNAAWAGTSAALVCQPHLGASLRKGWFRMIGTMVGAVIIVVLTALFAQDRGGFLVGLALWIGICAFVAGLLRNFATYAAALAGYTAAIIAADELGAVGGANGEAFMLAVTRVSEIWIGIVCAGIVLAGTDFGGAPRRLALLVGEVSSEIASRLISMLMRTGLAPSETQVAQHEVIRRVIALDPVIDEALGESARIRYHSPFLQEAVDGLFAALTGWRTAAARLSRLPDETARQQADAVLRNIPEELRLVLEARDASLWIADPIGLRKLFDATLERLTGIPTVAPSVRLLAEQTARALAGLSHALDGLALLVADPARPHSDGRFRLYVPDWLPALVNAARAFVTIGAIELLWIITVWPNGASAITFAAITITLLGPRADEAYTAAVQFLWGVCLAAVCAAILLFAGFPNVDSFVGFSILMGSFLVPVGALMAQPWQGFMFAAMAGNFLPLLGPADQMAYNTVQFYNAALAIAAGCGIAALSFRLLPPLSPEFRARRLLKLTLRDLRRLATSPIGRLGSCGGLMHSRLAAMPEAAEPLQRSQLIAALSVGTEIIYLRQLAFGLQLSSDPGLALEELALGNSAAAIAKLMDFDQRLAALAEDEPMRLVAARARTQVLAVCDALAQHRDLFDGALI